MTTTSYKNVTKQITSNLAPLRASVPQVMKSFTEMGKAAIADGALDAKTKELIALAIGIATRCDGCIGFHTKALARLGATKAEVHETLGVAVYMGVAPLRCTQPTPWPPSTSSWLKHLSVRCRQSNRARPCGTWSATSQPSDSAAARCVSRA